MREAAVHPNERLDEILEFLRVGRNIDFRGYKRSTLQRRISGRIAAWGLPDEQSYLRFLETHPAEVQELLDAILVNVTSFFRDPTVWKAIEKDILPEFRSRKPAADQIRVWSVGCASGEETYTIAMLLHRALGESRFKRCVKIVATDLDEEALASARQAIYSEDRLKPVPTQMRRQYFALANGKFEVRHSLRQAVIFGRHNVIEDAPISRIDLLLCRNLLIYLDRIMQQRVLERLHYALADGGYLMLGRVETIPFSSPLFSVANSAYRIFRRVPSQRSIARSVGTALNRDESADESESELRALQAVVDSISVAFLALSAEGNLTTVNSAARSLFGLSKSDIGRPLRELVPYLPAELSSRFREAVKKKRPVSVDFCRFLNFQGEKGVFSIDMRPFLDHNKTHYATGIYFYDLTRQHTLEHELRTAKEELDTVGEELQSANEELGTTNNELQSANEELEASNEELQSANEELEATNEELRSTNQTLSTTNEELRLQTEEAQRCRAYLDMILRNVGVGIIILDDGLRVTLWNRWCENMWGLRASEVEREKITDLDVNFPFDRIIPKVRYVRQGRRQNAELTTSAINRRGREIVVHIFVTPAAFISGERPTGIALIIQESAQHNEAPAGGLKAKRPPRAERSGPLWRKG